VRRLGAAFYGVKMTSNLSEVRLPHGLRDWPHSPVHRLDGPGTYIVTAATYQKDLHFISPVRLTFLTNLLLALAEKYGCSLRAWAVFANHYHFVGVPAERETLRRLTQHLHADTARYVNEADGVTGRKVWFQYWETQLTYHRSYLARLGYVHGNAVRHRLVRAADEYPWCSAGWFRRRAARSFYRTVMEFPVDRVIVPDDFGVLRGED
jgi:putative transposase